MKGLIQKLGDVQEVHLSLKDDALNCILEKPSSYQALKNYIATPSYEDFSLRMFPASSVNKILEKLKSFGKAKLVEKDLKPLSHIRPTLQTTLASVLTEQEEKILRIAGEMGWFEYPRPTQATMANIAERLSMSSGNLSIQLRNINRKLSEEYFNLFVSPR